MEATGMDPNQRQALEVRFGVLELTWKVENVQVCGVAMVMILLTHLVPPGANLMPRFQFGKPAGAKDQDVTNRQVFYETTMSAGLDEKKLMRPQNKTWAPQLP